jgi:hypothetical protein
MVAEPSDVAMDAVGMPALPLSANETDEMLEVDLPPSTNTSIYVSMRESPQLLFTRNGVFTPLPQKVRRAAGAGRPSAKEREQREIIAAQKREITSLKRKVTGVDGTVTLIKQDAEEKRLQRARESRREIKERDETIRAEEAQAEAAEAEAEAAKAKAKEMEKAKEDAEFAAAETLREEKKRWAAEKESAIQKKVDALKGTISKQLEINNRLRDEMKRMVTVDAYYAVQEQLTAAVALKQMLESSAADLECELADATNDLADATAGPGRGRHAEANASSYLATMKEECGVRAHSASVPLRASNGNSSLEQLSTRHMAAVIQGRGEGNDINLVADALHRCGYLERLVEAERFQPIVKGLVRTAVAKVQRHWSARHAVHVWDRLELSRSQMQTLTNLLSFVFDPESNDYVPIRVWENPNDQNDFVLTARLAGRHAREREFDAIASTMDITVGANGRVERDAIKCTSLLYSNYAAALRKTYSADRPAQPVLFLDGTGGSLGRGICHGEIGCADFIAVGDSDAKQAGAHPRDLQLCPPSPESDVGALASSRLMQR